MKDIDTVLEQKINDAVWTAHSLFERGKNLRFLGKYEFSSSELYLY